MQQFQTKPEMTVAIDNFCLWIPILRQSPFWNRKSRWFSIHQFQNFHPTKGNALRISAPWQMPIFPPAFQSPATFCSSCRSSGTGIRQWRSALAACRSSEVSVAMAGGVLKWFFEGQFCRKTQETMDFVPEKDMFSCFYPMRRVTCPTPTFYLAWQLQLIVVPSVSGTTKPPKWVETTKQRWHSISFERYHPQSQLKAF